MVGRRRRRGVRVFRAHERQARAMRRARVVERSGLGALAGCVGGPTDGASLRGVRAPGRHTWPSVGREAIETGPIAPPPARWTPCGGRRSCRMADQVRRGSSATTWSEAALALGFRGHTLVLNLNHKIKQCLIRPRKGGPGVFRLRGHQGRGVGLGASGVAPEFRDRGRAHEAPGPRKLLKQSRYLLVAPVAPVAPDFSEGEVCRVRLKRPASVRKSNKIVRYIHDLRLQVAMAARRSMCDGVPECGRGLVGALGTGAAATRERGADCNQRAGRAAARIAGLRALGGMPRGRPRGHWPDHRCEAKEVP